MENQDPGLFITGANTIDMAPNAQKEYKISLYSLKPISQKVNVFFKNADTQEYVFFQINVSVAPSEVQGTVEMTSMVRETFMKLVTIENPLAKPVTFAPEHLISDTDLVFFSQTAFVIPEKSEFGLEVNYRPLIVG